MRPDGEVVELSRIAVFFFGQPARFVHDGAGLVFMQGKVPSQDFWLLDIFTMKQRRLTELDDATNMMTFAITPDGTEIVFDRLSQDPGCGVD